MFVAMASSIVLANDADDEPDIKSLSGVAYSYPNAVSRFGPSTKYRSRLNDERDYDYPSVLNEYHKNIGGATHTSNLIKTGGNSIDSGDVADPWNELKRRINQLAARIRLEKAFG